MTRKRQLKKEKQLEVLEDESQSKHEIENFKLVFYLWIKNCSKP